MRGKTFFIQSRERDPTMHSWPFFHFLIPGKVAVTNYEKDKLRSCRSPWYTILNVQDNRRNSRTENLNALSSKFCFWFNHSETTESIAIFPLVKDIAKGTQTNEQAREERKKKKQAKMAGNKKIHKVYRGCFHLRRSLIQKVFSKKLEIF